MKPAVAVGAGVLALVSTSTTTKGAKVMAMAAFIYCAGRASGWMAKEKVARGKGELRVHYVGPPGSRFGDSALGLELRPD